MPDGTTYAVVFNMRTSWHVYLFSSQFSSKHRIHKGRPTHSLLGFICWNLSTTTRTLNHTSSTCSTSSILSLTHLIPPYSSPCIQDDSPEEDKKNLLSELRKLSVDNIFLYFCSSCKYLLLTILF